MKETSASALADLLELVARVLHSRGYAAGLFPAQWVALRYFARTPLARFQGLANGPVSRTVRTLITKGLLAKAASQPRGRAELLELTAAGQEVLAADPNRELETAIGALDPSDREVVARSLDTIIARLSPARR